MKGDCRNKSGIHRPRTNKFGVTWCIDCGRLHTKPNKPLVGKKLTTEEVEANRSDAYPYLF